MYGLIHCAIRDMVVKEHGESSWNSILKSSDIGSDAFLSMRGYHDDITLTLIGSCANELNMDLESFLESFGFFWLTEFAPIDYKSLLNLAGHEPFEFLRNLDRLHERISTSFVNLHPPVFSTQFIDDNCIELTYSSTRKGLTPFVTGILKGLPKMFDVALTIEKKHGVKTKFGEKSTYLITKINQPVVTHDRK